MQEEIRKQIRVGIRESERLNSQTAPHGREAHAQPVNSDMEKRRVSYALATIPELPLNYP